jgi:hypothetical protein
MTPQQQEIIKTAIIKYGVRNQLDQATEELAELIVEINKAKRAGIVYNSFVDKPNHETPLDIVKVYNDLCAEVADVKVMIAQLELILDEERIQISMDRKIKRLGDRLNLIPDKIEDKPSALNCGDCIHINIPDEEEPCRNCRDGLGNFTNFERV